MKNLKNNISLLSILAFSCIAQTAQACPTCIGRLEKETPPFFSSDYDTYWHDDSVSMDEENHTQELASNNLKVRQ